MKILHNESTKGLYAFFEHKGNQFCADLSFVPFVNKNVCSVYQARNNEIISYNELYYNDDNLLITEDILKQNIEKFKQNF